jgi:hypothetical protein
MLRGSAIALGMVWLCQSAAWAQFCPAGSNQVQSGYQITCVCPNGSLAGPGGCGGYSAPPQPQGVRCGNGYCPYGTTCSRNGNFCLDGSKVDCGSYTCSFGNKCASGNRCLPMNTVECGSGYCLVGTVCARNNTCVNVEQTGNGPVGFLETLLAKLNVVADVTSIPKLENSLSISKSVQSNGTPPMPWSEIQAQQQAFGGGPSVGMSPGNGMGTPAGYNAFTNSYSTPASNNNTPPNFIPPPPQPALQAAIQATKPVIDNLKDVQTMQMQPAPSQPNNGNANWPNPDPYNNHCTGAFKC